LFTFFLRRRRFLYVVASNLLNSGCILTEHELITLVQQKNEHAFSKLVTLFRDRVFNTALGMVQHEADAEDIAQEVFIKVYRSIGDFKKEADLFTWIYRITVNRCLDYLRSKQRRKRFGFITSFFGVDNDEGVKDFDHPGVQLDKKQDAAMLFKVMQQLPNNQRTAFVLSKVEGLSYQQIADVLDISSAAVDSLLQRAKQNLRKMIDQKYFNE